MKFALIAALLAAATLQAQTPIKTLILTGESDTQYHDWRVSTPFLRALLERTGRFEVKVIENPAGISAATLRPFDVLILNYMGPRWGATAEQAVEEFVRSGKGLLSFHGVTYGPLCGMVFDKRWKAGPDQGWPAYASLIGARWEPANIGHGRRGLFTVKWTTRDHPISKDLALEFLANDELYHRLTLLPGTQILATALSDSANGGTGKEEPIIWSTAFGNGRSVHLTLGHDVTAMSQPGFLAAFARSAEWAATSQVTLPANISLDRPAKDAVRVLVVTGGHTYPTVFYTLFEGQDDIVWTHAATQAATAADAFKANLASRFDVIVFHDMREEIETAAQANLRAFVEAGKGVVSIHHAMVDYTSWPWWWQEVIGGKYFAKEHPDHALSAYKEGVEMVVMPTASGRTHPVTRDIPPLVLEDEAYRGMWHSPKIQVLMETSFELNDRPVVFIGPHPTARVVCIQVGHSATTIQYPAYRKLVRNAVLWGARRLN